MYSVTTTVTNVVTYGIPVVVIYYKYTEILVNYLFNVQTPHF